MIELAVLLLVPLALLVAGFAWLVARMRPGWSRLLIIPLTALPLPVLILAASIAAMAYGWELPGDTCGLNECGGYFILGLLGIALSLGALVVGVPAAIVGAVIARRNSPPRESGPEYFQ